MNDLLEIGEVWEELMQKRSSWCNASASDVTRAVNMVNKFNNYKGEIVIRNMKSCQMPHILGLIQKELFAHGYIDTRFARKLNGSNQRIYEF